MRPIPPGMLEVVRDAMQIGGLLAFAIFIALGVRIAIAAPERRRRAINHLILYTIAVHALLIAAQRDLWPFSVYPMMATVGLDRSEQHTGIAAFAVDSGGHEWRVDAGAWSPLYPPSTLAWFDVGYPTASQAERTEVMRFLLDRAEKTRQARLEGKTFLGNRALLGPLAAPDTNLYWKGDMAPLPFEGLRIYRVFWNPTAFAKDPTQLTRKLVCEFRS